MNLKTFLTPFIFKKLRYWIILLELILFDYHIILIHPLMMLSMHVSLHKVVQNLLVLFFSHQHLIVMEKLSSFQSQKVAPDLGIYLIVMLIRDHILQLEMIMTNVLILDQIFMSWIMVGYKILKVNCYV